MPGLVIRVGKSVPWYRPTAMGSGGRRTVRGRRWLGIRVDYRGSGAIG
jgi:hypothetical protein